MTEIINKEEFEEFDKNYISPWDKNVPSIIRDTWIAAEQAFLEKQKEVRCENCYYCYRIGGTPFRCGNVIAIDIVELDFYCANFKKKEK